MAVVTTNQHITKAHDHFFKMTMKDLRVAREFLQMHLPQDLQQGIQWESLEPQPTAHVNRSRNESISDVAFRVLIDDKEAYLHLMVDHQSTPDILMPFRAENYRYNLIDAYVKQHPGTKTIPLVIPIVLYHGAVSWSHSMDITDLVDAPKAFVHAYAFKPFIFVDLNRIEDADLRQNLRAGVMQLALKHIFAKNILPHVETIMILLRQLEQGEEHDLVDTVLKYLLDRGEMQEDDFFNLLKTTLSSDVEGRIMTVSEQLIARGMQQGVQQGMQQGRRLASLDTARILLHKGMSIANIVEVTGLSVGEIRKLQELEF